MFSKPVMSENASENVSWAQPVTWHLVPRHVGKDRKERKTNFPNSELYACVSSYRDDGNSPRTINVSVQMRSDCQWWVHPGEDWF